MLATKTYSFNVVLAFAPPSHMEQVERKGNKEDIAPEQKEKLEKVYLCGRNRRTFVENELRHIR